MTALRIGFACRWDPDKAATWSGVPWRLRTEISRHAEVVDVGVELPGLAQTALKALHARWREQHWWTTWEHSPVTDLAAARSLRKALATQECDAVLQMQDLAVVDPPFFLYQDLSYDLLLEFSARGLPVFFGLDRDTLLRRAERQRGIYQRSAGVFAMSRWLADYIVRYSGVAEDKVHVVPPGLGTAATDAPIPVREGPRRRLLFVGRQFHRKGGDLVVAALALLRRDVDPGITLTVVGPKTWPLPGEVPDGVDFRGLLPASEVAALYDSHDLYVQPSRFEAFGVAFAEAISRGLPCIARDAYAMPEIVQPGLTGALVAGEAPQTLAAAIATALADDDLYAECARRAAHNAARFSWDRAGSTFVATIAATLGSAAESAPAESSAAQSSPAESALP